MTYFKTNYETQDSPLGESFEIPFDNQNITFGSTYECTIPSYGDLLTSTFLRVTLPAIYPPQAGTYVYPQTSTSFSGALYAQKNLTYVTADGSNLTANTSGSHFFSVGSNVILTETAYSFFNLDGVYTISSVPTSNSFVCSTKLTGVSYNGVVSSVGILPAPVVGYYSTQNLNLWAEILVNNQIAVTYDPVQNKFVFTSTTYPFITFASAQDAAFWGFDYRQGPSFPLVNGALTSQWTLPQGGWIQGFLPPSLSNYDDSVAHKLVKEARVLVGRQVIKRYTGEYMELINDLTIPYENKAILKLMNGTLDFTQAVAAREYYVNIPLGCESIPLCALTRQQMSIEIDFEEYQNLSNDLNKGTGNFFDPNSYLTYNVSQNLLGGSNCNISSTLSYQQYILLLTIGGVFIVYDTTKPIDEPGSYQIITAFVGQTAVFVNFVILGNILYIQLLNGYLVSGLLDELIQGNVSSFISNNYLPTSVQDAGPPTGTMVCDARYTYYAESNLSQSNVFFVQYDTTTPFQELGGYTSFDFTSNIDANVSSVYQILSTGSNLIALTNTPGTFYVFPITGNFLTDWSPVSYGSGQITEGVVIGTSVYFLLDNSSIVVYSNGQFTTYTFYYPLFVASNFYGSPPFMTSPDGVNWTPQTAQYNNWSSVTYANGLFVAVYLHAFVMTSPDGVTWTPQTAPFGGWQSVTYGNGLFVAVADGSQNAMSSPDGVNWSLAQTPPQSYVTWQSVTYGNGLFVAVSSDSSSLVATSSDGTNWSTYTSSQYVRWYSVTYGNGLFVAVNTDNPSPPVMTSPDGVNWTPQTAPFGYWDSVTYGNGLFVAVNGGSGGPPIMTSPDGVNWTPSTNAPSGYWSSVTYGNGLFVCVSAGTSPSAMTSSDGVNWTESPLAPFGYWSSVTNKAASTPGILPYLGPIKNLHAVGSTIYASANTSSSASIIQIDTTQDLSTPAAYQYYSSNNAPIAFAGNVPSIFANGPRFLYIFTNDPSQSSTTPPQNAIRYDPYPSNPTLQASIIADYKILPPGVPKPTWAEIKYVQSQHVTAESFADLQLLGPVKELIVTGTANVANVYQYSNLDGAVSLTITGNEEIITPDVGTVTGLGVMAPFQTHTVLPVRNLSVIPFEVNPESLEPNGTINFSRLMYQNLSNGSSVWATSYNILRIESGVGGLKFNSPY